MASSRPSIALRATLALALLIGFYALALGAIALCVWLPYAEWTSSHRLDARLLLVCGFGAVVILVSIVPRRRRFVPPGPRLLAADHPRLFRALEGVAASTGQPMPGEVYLIVEPNAFVTERGGRHRVMGIGYPLLQALTVAELEAILAHEFGHFQGGDTRLGLLVYRTREAIVRTIQGLASAKGGGGLVTVCLWMLRLPFVGYAHAFLRVSHAVSRRQELAADALAARVVGPEALASGLQVVHTAATAFPRFAALEVQPLLQAGYRPPLGTGFVRYLASPSVAASAAKAEARALAGSKASPYDTHPPLKDRLEALGAPPARATPRGAEPAVSLLDHADELEVDLLAGATRSDKVRSFPTIEWDEFASRIVAPLWCEEATRHGRAVAGWTPLDFADRQGQLERLGRSLIGESANSGDATQRAMWILESALAACLLRRGWIASKDPGEPVGLRRDSLFVSPGDSLSRLASGRMPAVEWRSFCRSAGIADIDLGESPDPKAQGA